MYCTNCGKEINNDVKFCPFCGVKSEKDNTIEEYEEGKMMESVNFTDNSIKGGKKKSLFIRLSLVAVVGVLVVFVGFGFGKKTEVSKEANAVEGYVYVDGEGDLFYCKDFEKNESILLDHEVHAASNTLVYSLDGRGIYYLKEFDEITNVGKLFFAEFDRNGKKQKPILIDDAVKTDHLNAISEGVIYTKDEKDQVKLCYHNGNESVTIVRAQRSYMIHTMLCKETSMFYYIVYDEMLQNGDLFVFMPDEEEMKRKVTSNVDRLYSNKELLEQGIFVYAELYDETEEVYNETYYNREKLFAVKNGEKAELIAPYVQNVLATTWSEEKGLEIYYTYEDFLVTNKYDFFVIDDFETVDLEWLAWDGSNIFQDNYLSKLDKNIEAYHRDLLRQDLKAAPFIVTDKTMCKYSGIDQSSEVVCENVKDFLLTFPDEEVFVYTQYLAELDERVDPYIDIISIESADDLTEETITYAVVLNMNGEAQDMFRRDTTREPIEAGGLILPDGRLVYNMLYHYYDQKIGDEVNKFAFYVSNDARWNGFTYYSEDAKSELYFYDFVEENSNRTFYGDYGNLYYYNGEDVVGIEPNVRRAYVSDRYMFLETLSDDDDGIFYRYDKNYYVENSFDDTLKIKIASDITDIDIISDEELVFISAGDLYYWSGGEKTMIHSDVKTLKCGKESYGYERMFPIASQY